MSLERLTTRQLCAVLDIKVESFHANKPRWGHPKSAGRLEGQSSFYLSDIRTWLIKGLLNTTPNWRGWRMIQVKRWNTVFPEHSINVGKVLEERTSVDSIRTFDRPNPATTIQASRDRSKTTEPLPLSANYKPPLSDEVREITNRMETLRSLPNTWDEETDAGGLVLRKRISLEDAEKLLRMLGLPNAHETFCAYEKKYGSEDD